MLPTVEPQRAHEAAPTVSALPAQQAQPQQASTEILGNTVDPFWRFSNQTVPTRCALTLPGGLPFGFVCQPFAAPEDSGRCGSSSAPHVLRAAVPLPSVH